MTRLVLLLAFYLGIQFSAVAQCGNCNQTYSGSGSTNFNLNGNQTLCITSDLNGRININGSNTTICVANGVTFNWTGGNANGSFTLNSYGETNITFGMNIPSNSAINVYANGELSTRNMNFNGAGTTINNEGTWTMYSNLTLNQNVDVTNSGILNANSRNLIIQGTFENTTGAEMTNVNTLTVENSFAEFTNNGDLTVIGSGANAFQIRNSAEVINGANGTINATNARIRLSSAGSLVNSGSLASSDFFNDHGDFTNTQDGVYNVVNDFSNGGPSVNEGQIIIGGDFFQSNKGVSGTLVNNGFFDIEGDFTVSSNAYLNGNGGYQIDGNSFNDGNVSDVDICDQSSNNGGGFDGGSGSTNGTTTCSYSALPVELTFFELRKNGTTYHFEWQTASEVNASHFVLESMDEDGNIQEVDRIACAGNTIVTQDYSSYTFNFDFNGVKYYRLVQHDFDGKFETYNWVAVSGANEYTEELSIYPNPAKDYINVDLSGFAHPSKTVMLFNANGALIASFTTHESQLRIDLRSYTLGNYIFAEIVSGGEVKRAKIQIL